MKNADLYHLTRNCYHEARGEPDFCVKAVVKVVFNRVKRRKQTIQEVIYAPWQFSWTMEENKNPLLHNPSEYKRIKVLVKQAVEEYNNGNTLNGADHYHGDYMDPYPNWVNGMQQMIGHFGKHIFYRS